ncbi:MAG: N-methyltryptophan oxidase [Xanthobacteraceae bacterium]|nr:N-methyltryptophan oxidase [Xanthobacteraceae bacterium]
MPDFDVVVVGLGAMGSAALDALARRGVRALGLEQFQPGHARGSSHGATRIIRFGYFEHPSYVPLVRAALPLWRDLEARSGQTLLTVTGVLEIGAPDSELIAGTLQASRDHALPHEVLDAEALHRRFPAFRVPSDYVGVFQPDGGYLMADKAVAAMIASAKAAGAEVRSEERVLRVTPHGDGVRVETGRGSVTAGAVVVAAGPWVKSLLPELPMPIHVTRQAVGFFAPVNREPFASGFPVFMIENPDGIFYGFPPDETGAIKFAKHHHRGERIDPDQPDRPMAADDEALIRGALKAHLPAANGPMVASLTCRYTMTPDGDFVIDRLPDAPQIVVASPCSGHGFKFAPAIGEILADLSLRGDLSLREATEHDISRFRLSGSR